MPNAKKAMRQQRLDWIAEDQDALVDFFSGFVAQASPNPAGDTRDATKYLANWMTAKGINPQIVAPQEEMPNILAVTDGAGPGRLLSMGLLQTPCLARMSMCQLKIFFTWCAHTRLPPLTI